MFATIHTLTSRPFIPKKYLGQNFLIDQNIKHKIIAACELQTDDIVLEIGPGLGVLTEETAPHVKQLFAIETDPTLAKELQNKFKGSNINVIQADFLKYPLNSLPPHLKVIGNLPYYISTPIMERIIMNPIYFDCIYATLQYELGQRLRAKVNSKEYGAFTCFVQYYMDVKMLFKVKNTSFKPVPNVHSSFLKFTRKKEQNLKTHNETLLFKIIRCAFQQRRKTIVNALSNMESPEKIKQILKSLGINEKGRAENLTLEDYIQITRKFEKL